MTDECTMIYAANKDRHQLSAGRRDLEQTHSVTHSHTDTLSEQSQVEKKKTESFESLFVLSIPCFFVTTDLSVSLSLSPDAAGRSG